jgi:glucokinase
MAEVYIALDIGGTKFMAASFGRSNEILRQEKASAPQSLHEGLALLKSLGRKVAGADTIVSVGASAGGPLDYITGIISPLHNPEWREGAVLIGQFS